ncbi:MAG: hypothetical protein PSX71_12790 [bacterium]|nr:hypothetical protein [bacterium]
MKTQDSINAGVVIIVTASTLLQGIALLGLLPIAAGSIGRQVFSSVEMLLVLLLLMQGWRIRQWSLASGQDVLVRKTATLCFFSLLLCTLGDFVNRNYFGQYYQWDAVIKHSYLIEAIGFFFPGYFLVVLVNWQISRHRVSTRWMAGTVLLMLLAGTLAYGMNHDPRINAVSSALILLYTLLLSVLAGSTLWIIKTYGWAASSLVVTGMLLAPVADALIGNFWIYRDYFPVIEHVNWIIYFTSLAMIQQLPFFLARAKRENSDASRAA